VYDGVVHPRESSGGLALPVFPRLFGNVRNTRGHEE
jgi:hypothetical protein